MSLLFRLTRGVISNPVVARNILQRVRPKVCIAMASRQIQPRVFMSQQLSEEQSDGAKASNVTSDPVEELFRLNRIRWESRKRLIRNLEQTLTQYEERCQRYERVLEKEFVRTFNSYTKTVQELGQEGLENRKTLANIIVSATSLLRSCGNLMIDVPPKRRELLAGNLWTFLKENKIPLDVSHYNSLIRVLNENETNYDPKSILAEMKERNLTPDRVTYQRMIHQYCLQADISSATGLLETMKEEGMPLNEAIFASLILGYCKQDKPPAITEMFDLMRSNGVEPSAKSYAAALIAQGERMKRDPEGGAAEFAQTCELLNKDEIIFSVTEKVDLITHLSPLRKTQDVVDEFMNTFVNNIEGSATSRYRILAAFLRANQIEEASKLYWSEPIHGRARESGNLGNHYIKALATHFNVPVDFALSECYKMVEDGRNPKAFHNLYYRSAEAGRLDVVRAAMKKIAENEPMKIQYTWPLIAQAKSQEEVIEVLKNDLNPQMNQSDLRDTLSMWVWPKIASDDVRKSFDLLKELKYDVHLLMASFIDFAIQGDKLTDAIKFIMEAPSDLVGEAVTAEAEAGHEEEDRQKPYSSDRPDLIPRLLNQIAVQTKDPQLVRKAFEMWKLPTQRVPVMSLSCLVKVHLANNDFKGAIEEFLRISEEYRMTPCSKLLMKHCLTNKDPDSLQKIMKTLTELHGESNSLFDLALCCLKTDKLKQAQKIFASPGFRVNPERVYRACRELAEYQDITTLENFVNLSRDMHDIKQEYLYQVLLNTYDQTSNAKRALNLWNTMQEEEFQPSRKSLEMIADILEKNNIEVPFQRPGSTYQDKGFQKSQLPDS